MTVFSHAQRFPLALMAALFMTAGCQDSTPPAADPRDEAAAAAIAIHPAADALNEEEAGEPADEPPTDVAQTSYAITPAISLDALPEGVNIVQHEMQVLTEAMQNNLRHLADGNLAAIPKEIARVHPIYDLTHEALGAGLYNPPFNSENIAGFEALDEAFHDDLRTMVASALDDDLQGTTVAYAKLVTGCTSCHTQFRFEPATP